MGRRRIQSAWSFVLLLTACGNSAPSRSASPGSDQGSDAAADSTMFEASHDDAAAREDSVVAPRDPVGTRADAGNGAEPTTPDDAGGALPDASTPVPASDLVDAGDDVPSECTGSFELIPEAPADLASGSSTSVRLLPLRDGRLVGFNSYASLNAVYDPDLNEWTSLPDDGASVSVSDVHVLGDFVVLWPGASGDGAIFDVPSNSWSTAVPAPFPESLTSEGGHVVAGQYLGFESNFGEVEFEIGFRFDPVTNQWSEIGGNGPPFRRLGFVSIPTESGLFVWGGAERLTGDVGDVTELPLLGDGALLSPEDWTWQSISADGAPSPRSTPVSVWTGEEVIIYGGFARVERSSAMHEPLNDGHRYDPATDTWAPLGAPGPLLQHPASAAWTGRQLLVWSRNEDSTAWVGGVYDAETGSWTDLQLPDAFPVSLVRIHTTNDGRVVVFPKSGMLPATVFVYASDTGWRAIPTDVDVEPRSGVEPAWASDRLILWGGYTSLDPPGQCEDVPDDQGCDPIVEFTSVLDGVVFRPCAP